MSTTSSLKVARADYLEWHLYDKFDGPVVGRAWADEHEPGLRAFVHIDVLPQYRGKPALDAARQCLADLFAYTTIEAAWGSSFDRAYGVFFTALGFDRVAVLPRFILKDNLPADITLYRLTRDQWEATQPPSLPA